MSKQVSLTNTIIIAIIVAILSFYGGMSYAGSKTSSATRQAAYGQGGAAGAFGGGAAGAGGARRGGTGAAGGGFTTGTVISADSQSVTIQLKAGGSQIILLSGSTAIEKTAAGTMSDLTPGTNVSVTGTTNSDGSITASSVQIRPAMMGGMPGSASSTRGGYAAGAPTQQ